MANDTLYTKTGDTRPEFAAVLKDQDGVIDCSLVSSVRLILKKPSPLRTIAGICTLTTIAAAIDAGLVPTEDPETNAPWTATERTTICVARYPWVPADTSVSGTYNGEIELTHGLDLIETVPKDGFFTVVMTEDLD